MQRSTHASIERFTRIVLLLALFGFFFRGYWIYSHDDHTGGIGPYMDLINGRGPAPFQYRIGPVRVAYWMYAHLHLPFRLGFSIEDLICSVTAVLVGYWLLCRRPLYREAGVTMRWFASSAFVALVLYLLAWQDWYKKNDTEPAAALTMLLLALWSAKDGGRTGGGKTWLLSVGVLAVTAVESVVRPEIALWMAVGIFVVALLPRRGPLSMPRPQALLTAALAAMLAAGIQLLMSRVVYPNAHYLSGIVFMLPYDWFAPQGWADFAAYLAPAAWTGWKVYTLRALDDAAGVGFLLGALPFVLLWVLVGRIEEVRIFLPVGLALAPLTCQMLMRTAQAAEESAV